MNNRRPQSNPLNILDMITNARDAIYGFGEFPMLCLDCKNASYVRTREHRDYLPRHRGLFSQLIS